MKRAEGISRPRCAGIWIQPSRGSSIQTSAPPPGALRALGAPEALSRDAVEGNAVALLSAQPQTTAQVRALMPEPRPSSNHLLNALVSPAGAHVT